MENQKTRKKNENEDRSRKKGSRDDGKSRGRTSTEKFRILCFIEISREWERDRVTKTNRGREEVKKRQITDVETQLQLTCQILNKIPGVVDFRAIDNSVVIRTVTNHDRNHPSL